jgi:hypothetical protein
LTHRPRTVTRNHHQKTKVMPYTTTLDFLPTDSLVWFLFSCIVFFFFSFIYSFFFVFMYFIFFVFFHIHFFFVFPLKLDIPSVRQTSLMLSFAHIVFPFQILKGIAHNQRSPHINRSHDLTRISTDMKAC